MTEKKRITKRQAQRAYKLQLRRIIREFQKGVRLLAEAQRLGNKTK